MLITINSFNGNSINDGSNYRAYGLNLQNRQAAKPVFIDEPMADPVDSGMYTVDVWAPVIDIKITNYANRWALISQLKQWCKRGTQGNLIVTFSDDGLQYQISCRVVNLTQDPTYGDHWLLTLQTGTTAWRAVNSEAAAAWNPTGAGGTTVIAVGGNDRTRLIASLTPSSGPATNYLYQNLQQIINVPGINHGLRPWVITLDTHALNLAGKMRADCFDLRIFIDGVETKRWIKSPNTTTTQVIFNAKYGPGQSIPLGVAVSSGGAITVLQFSVNPTNVAAVAALPASGIFVHGTEWIAYSGKNSTACNVTVVQRGAYGTTKQAHNVGDVFKFQEHAVIMFYGNANAVDPSTLDANYDATKPLCNFPNNDNTQWSWDNTTLFYDPTNPGRTGGWSQYNKQLGAVSHSYAITQDGLTGDPALGSAIGAYLSGSLPRADTAIEAWQLHAEAAFQTVSMTGAKNVVGSGWPAIAGLQVSTNGKTWAPATWTEAKPTSAWQAFSHTAVSVATTSKWLQVGLNGTTGSASGSLADLEVLTATVTFVSANLPAFSALGEKSNYQLTVTLSNTTNGDTVTLTYAMLIGKAFLLDCENFAATYDLVNALAAMVLDDPGRADGWLRLEPGNNTISIASVDMGTLGVALSWYRRRI
jgi:hypothetical protein